MGWSFVDARVELAYTCRHMSGVLLVLVGWILAPATTSILASIFKFDPDILIISGDLRFLVLGTFYDGNLLSQICIFTFCFPLLGDVR